MSCTREVHGDASIDILIICLLLTCDCCRRQIFGFLADPSPIIGYACHSLTHSLIDSRLVNLIDLTLACKDAYSKLVEVVTIADVDAEDHVGNSKNPQQVLSWHLHTKVVNDQTQVY